MGPTRIMTKFDPLAGFIRAMRHRHYRNYTIGSVLSLIGTWTHRVALSWLTWELTGSYVWLGIIAFSDMFMMMLVTPLAGDLADRMDRRRVAFWSQFAMMCQAATIAILVFLGWINVWGLLVLTMALGAMHAYHTASRLAMVPNLVPEEDLTPAIAINSLIFNVARFVGPAVAGVIIAGVGVGPAFTFNALTFVIFLIVLARLEMLRSEHRPGRGGGIIFNVTEGIRYAAGHAGIGPLLVMLAVTAFAARSLPDLMPGFADGVFQRGPAGLAWLTAMMGLGAMGSGFVLLARDGVRGMTAMVTHCLVLLGIVTVVFVLMDIFWIAAVVMVAIGFTMNLNGVGVLNLMQSAVDGALRGRVMAIYTFLYQGAPAAGTLLLGGIAEYTGLPWPVGAAGVFLMLVWLWMVRRLGAMTATLEGTEPATRAREPAR
jgi:MFS family permease